MELLRALGLVCLAVIGVVTARMATGGLRVPKRRGCQREHGDASSVVTMEPMRAALVLLATLATTFVILFTAR